LCPWSSPDFLIHSTSGSCRNVSSTFSSESRLPLRTWDLGFEGVRFNGLVSRSLETCEHVQPRGSIRSTRAPSQSGVWVAWTRFADAKKRQACHLHSHSRNVCETSKVAADTHRIDDVLCQAEWHPLWHSERLTLVEEAGKIDVDAVARRGIKQNIFRVPGGSFERLVMNFLQYVEQPHK